MPIGNPLRLTSDVSNKTISQIATASQTVFTIPGGYRLNYISVFRNGVRLVESRDYDARDGISVILYSPSTVNDVLEFELFDTINVADTVNSNDDNVNFAGNVNILGNLNVIGVTTIAGAATSVARATTAYSLTGIPNISVGIITANSASFGGNVSIAGTLTYEDVTNIDSVGLITARSGINATGVVTATSFVGNGTIPVGGIIMWSGSIASIPTGWALCNGSNGTPNLTDKFIVGAGNNYSVAGVGGTADAVVVDHTHTVTDPGHNHTYQRNNGAWNTGTSGNTAVAANQGESSPNTSTAFTNISIASTGVSGANKNLPPYYALAFIMRTV